MNIMLIDLACRMADSANLTSPYAADAIRIARGVAAGTHTQDQARVAEMAVWAETGKRPHSRNPDRAAGWAAAAAATVTRESLVDFVRMTAAELSDEQCAPFLEELRSHKVIPPKWRRPKCAA